MKHILPILTITTLAAAASAQTPAAASGLSYNRAGLSYNTDKAAGDNGYSLSVEALIGSSNIWIAGSADLNSAGEDSVSIGYVFKNVAAGIDATVAVSSDDNYGIILRRSLNEVVAGLEARLVYARQELLIFGLEVSPKGPGNGALFVARVGRYLDSTCTVTRISRSPDPQ